MFKEPVNDPRKWFISHDVEVKESTIPGAGAGGFAVNDIPARTIIEKSPVVIVGQDIFHHLNDLHDVRNVLCDYPFQWYDGKCAFALGWGGVYNHSFDANVKWHPHEEEGANCLVYTTKRDIKAGEELFVRYCWSADKLWFVDESVDMGHNRRPGPSGVSMGMQAQTLFGDMARVVGADARGHQVETLGDFKKVSQVVKSYQQKKPSDE